MRYLALFLLASATGLTTLWMFNLAHQNPQKTPLWEAKERAEKLAAERKRSDAFRSFVAELATRLADGSFNLKSASERLHDYSSMCYPNYLKHVRFVEGSSDLNGVALNLIRHFEMEMPAGPEREALLRRLRGEFDEMNRRVTRTPKSTPRSS